MLWLIDKCPESSYAKCPFGLFSTYNFENIKLFLLVMHKRQKVWYLNLKKKKIHVPQIWNERCQFCTYPSEENIHRYISQIISEFLYPTDENNEFPTIQLQINWKNRYIHIEKNICEFKLFQSITTHLYLRKKSHNYQIWKIFTNNETQYFVFRISSVSRTS